jgi:MFS family permease
MNTPSESTPVDEAPPPPLTTTTTTSTRLPVAIWVFGFVSMLMDVASEMIHGLLPAWLVGTVGLSVAMVGLLDGVAEATALVVKVFSGALSDALGKRKPMAVIGYGLAALSKPLFALGGVPLVVGARIIDRIGKGIRGAPRDALLTEIAPPSMRGAAFGLRQSLDSIGALLGPLIAIALMWALHDDTRTVFLIATIPGVLSVLLLAVAIREPLPTAPSSSTVSSSASSSTATPFRWPLRGHELRQLPSAYWLVVALATAFMLARISEGFLVLRAQQLGLGLGLVPLVLVGMNAVYALSAWPMGRLADRMPRPTLLGLSLVVLLAGHLVLMRDSLAAVAVGVTLWGLHLGLSQGVLSAMVADTAPSPLRGTAFGLFHLVSGAATLVSSTVAGVLWQAAGPAATFTFGAVASVLTLLALWWVQRRRAAST